MGALIMCEEKASRLQHKLIPRVLSSDWLILAACVLLSYLNGINGDFVFDDIPLLRNDAFYREGRMLDCWRRNFWAGELDQGLYRPLTTFSYWLNVHVFGAGPQAFRAAPIAAAPRKLTSR